MPIPMDGMHLIGQGMGLYPHVAVTWNETEHGAAIRHGTWAHKLYDFFDLLFLQLLYIMAVMELGNKKRSRCSFSSMVYKHKLKTFDRKLN